MDVVGEVVEESVGVYAERFGDDLGVEADDEIDEAGERSVLGLTLAGSRLWVRYCGGRGVIRGLVTLVTIRCGLRVPSPAR